MRSSRPLDDRYLTWLSKQVSNGSRSYRQLFLRLYRKEFVWTVPNDDNRVEAGKELRYEFIDDQRIVDMDRNWLELGCSMLEMLIALSRGLSFYADGEPRAWFWHLLSNIGLDDCDDMHMKSDEDIDDILDCVIWRTYDRNGNGGLFPLRRAKKDQRKVEIWYQMSAYLLELD